MLHRKQYRVAVRVTIMVLALTLTACGTQENIGSTESVKSTETVENTETVKGTETVESTETIENVEIIEAMVSESAAPQGMANVTPQMQPEEYTNLQQITLDSTWEYADHSKINTGAAVLYLASEESGRKGIVIGVNAGHGTAGGANVKTLCHPDGSAKVTGGSTAAGAMEAAAVSGGMTFQDGTPEREVTLRMAQILRDKLLSSGYDVLMLRDSEDVQLDNVARTVICNNVADCHIALHWDSGDSKNYDKGCFYISVPEALKNMEPVASHWQQHDTLGTDLVEGLREQGATIYGKGHMGIDLTQTSYSTIPSVDMELGNAYSDHSDVILEQLATGLLTGINTYFEQ